jgi:hypothetical protein
MGTLHLSPTKNRAYGVKKQVPVMASSPHNALFVSPEIPAETYDREILKKNYENISFYLGEKDSENRSIHGDQESSWALLCDINRETLLSSKNPCENILKYITSFSFSQPLRDPYSYRVRFRRFSAILTSSSRLSDFN